MTDDEILRCRVMYCCNFSLVFRFLGVFCLFAYLFVCWGGGLLLLLLFWFGVFLLLFFFFGGGGGVSLLFSFFLFGFTFPLSISCRLANNAEALSFSLSLVLCFFISNFKQRLFFTYNTKKF